MPCLGQQNPAEPNPSPDALEGVLGLLQKLPLRSGGAWRIPACALIPDALPNTRAWGSTALLTIPSSPPCARAEPMTDVGRRSREQRRWWLCERSPSCHPSHQRPLPGPTGKKGPRTVVVFIRPPGCVHVQPDRLMSKSQPSPSRQGSMSHHCLVLMIRAVERGRRQLVSGQPAGTSGSSRGGLSPSTSSGHWTSQGSPGQRLVAAPRAGFSSSGDKWVGKLTRHCALKIRDHSLSWTLLLCHQPAYGN